MKKCRLTLEVEEIYSDVIENSKIRNKEIDYIKIADDYIFATELLRKDINNNKKTIICYGNYKISSDFGKRFNDNKIHIVYAGTFERKKGVITAISMAKYLGEEYCVDILGSGSQEETDFVTTLLHIYKRVISDCAHNKLMQNLTERHFRQKY